MKLTVFLLACTMAFPVYAQNGFPAVGTVFGDAAYISYNIREYYSPVIEKYNTVAIQKCTQGTMSVDWITEKNTESLPVPCAVADEKPPVGDSARHGFDSIYASWANVPQAYVSLEKQKYTVDGKDYDIYRFAAYNCNDPMCRAKHGHLRFKMYEIFLSPEYGVLAHFNGFFRCRFLQRVNGVKVPEGLILAILKGRNTPDNFVDGYMKDCRRMAQNKW